uniref:Uncharacterized protein n=1 Tax=Rhizophora mucronata TaxID=61149 RepID=A0A2P2N0E4_RHIMU
MRNRYIWLEVVFPAFVLVLNFHSPTKNKFVCIEFSYFFDNYIFGFLLGRAKGT